ncbi:MAG TPA: nuclease-related domain-containing protein [Ureibacillus sp.]|nr:nuclease-related domain-containing protein [Ureibacillus sp.]
MFVLERKKGNSLLTLESIMRRLRSDDTTYQRFQDMYYKLKKGYEGEQRVDKEWREIELPYDYCLLHNYETVNEFGHSHQMDTLLITQKFIFVVEIKSITGRIDMDPTSHQFKHTKPDNTVEIYLNPLDQVKRHVRFLQRQLSRWSLYLPIEYAILASSTNTVIGDMPKNIPFLQLSGLNSFVSMLEQKHPKERISSCELEQLRIRFLSNLKRNSWIPKMDRSKLIKGAICEQCKTSMNYYYGRFICESCGLKSKDSVLQGLHDYRLLFSPWIKNSEFRNYFGLSSSVTSYKLLHSLDLRTEGINRGRIYYIPENILEHKIR